MTRLITLAALFASAVFVHADDDSLSIWKHTVLCDGKPAVGAKVIFAELNAGVFEDVKSGATAETSVDAAGIAQVPRTKGSTAKFARVLVRDAAGRCGYGTAFSSGDTYPKTIDLKDTTILSGRITDAAGQPIPALKMKAVALGPETFVRFGGKPMAYAETPDAFWGGFAIQLDADGSFRVPGVLVQHSVAVQFTAPSVGSGRFWIEPGKPAAIRLDKAGAIRLAFTVPPNARPAPQRIIAKRAVSADNGHLEVTAEVTSIAGGPITISNLPPGTYQFTPPYPGPNDHYPAAVAPLVVKAGTTVDANIVYQPAARVIAKLIDNKTNKGVAGATLHVMTIDADQRDVMLTAAKADTEGLIDLRVPAGLISVAPQSSDSYAAVKFSRNPFREYATDAIPIAAGAQHDFGQFALAPTIDIAGTVVDEAGQAVAGAHVMAGFSGNNFYRGPKIISDDTGRFVIRGMNPDGGVFGVIAAKGEQLTGPPVAVDLAAPVGELRLVVSEKFAARVRARVIDRKRQPIAGATVELSDSVRHLSHTGGSIGSGTAGKVGETKSDGVYVSEPLQAGNKTYGITFSAPGYRAATTPNWEAKPGVIHDFGAITLTRTNCVVNGVVTDRAGKPIAGAILFSNADGPRPTRTTADTSGQFTLSGLFEGPAIISAKADGFVLASRSAESDGPAITFALRRATEAPDPPPAISDEYCAAWDKLARHVVEAMWANRVAAKDDGATTIRAMARLDPATARRWRDEEKARGQTDLTKEIDAAERERTIDGIARRDPDEAVALMKSNDGIAGFRAVCLLCDKLCADAPQAAQRLAEEAVTRARGLPAENRNWALAQAGEMVYRAGRRDAGRKIIEASAENVEAIDAQGPDGYRRGMIAARLANFDPARTRRLIDPMTSANDFNRWLGLACVRLAMTDLPLAKQWLREFRPGNTFAPQQSRQHIAYRLAKTNPDEAIAMIDSIEDRTCRMVGYADLASRFADRARGIQLIDRTIERIVEDPSGYFNNNGNGGGTAAYLVYYGKKIGHPDLAGLRDHVLAARTPPSDLPFSNGPMNSNVLVAQVLALTDPDTARLILAKGLPPETRINVDSAELAQVLVAVVICDPAAAAPMADRAIAEAVRTQTGYNRFNLSWLAYMLTHDNGKFAYLSRTYIGHFEEE